MRKLLLAAALALPGVAFGQQKTVAFDTADGCRLNAYYLAPSSGAYVFINTHGLGSGKYEWAPLQEELARRGFGYLSLDMRGHGESATCAGKPVSYKLFTKADWGAVSHDIEAAAAWLKKKGVPPARQVFCGASIGANLSLKAAAEGKLKPAALVLLSPGMDYAGVKAGDYLEKAPARLLVAASPDDPYAWQSAGALVKAAGGKASFADGRSGHGANMFKTPGMTQAIVDWADAR
jgi:alpha-beta hydrolase superfamily lysophospholipase